MKYLNTFRGFLLTLLLVCVGSVSAHDFEVGGIYYKILSETDKTVEVTYKGNSDSEYSNEYIGNVVIPTAVTKPATTNSIVINSFNAWTSTNKSHSTTSQKSYTLNVEAGNILKFDWSVSSESNYDWLVITLDGAEIIKKSGTQSGSYEKTFDSTGSHILVMKYTKDSSQSKGNDEGKIYNITLNSVVSTTNGITYRVTAIGDWAFYNCSGITSVEIPGSVMDLGKMAFAYCTSLKEVIIKDATEALNYKYDQTNLGYFFKDSPIEYMYIGRDLENCPFDYYYGQWRKTLKTVVFGSGVTTISNSFFDTCSKLSSVTFSNSVKNIGINAFRDCNNITNIVLPNSLLSIGAYAFEGCAIANITIPKNVTQIGRRAFGKSKYIESILVESGNSVYDSRSNCDAIIETSTNTLISGCKNTKIPNSVTSIGDCAFHVCTTLTDIEIPNSVVSIGESAFTTCTGITNVIIPGSATSIGDYAFQNCSNLNDIKFNSNPSLGEYAIPSTAKCHLILDDGNTTDFDITNANTYADVSFSRTIAEGKYGTIILPFAPNATSLENYAFYELAESGDGYMKFEEVATPVANTPYIYTLREGKENIAITAGETTISSTVETPVVDGWQTVGSFTNQALDTRSGNYYAFSPSKNEINKITKNLTVLPYREYFKSDNASKSAFSVHISGTTGIKEVLSSEIDGFDTEVIYDLSGRKILDPVRGGIYIINGKKVKF